MDITDNMLVETAAGPVALRPAPQPEPACLPMLHIAAPHHPLDAPHVQKVGLVLCGGWVGGGGGSRGTAGRCRSGRSWVLGEEAGRCQAWRA